MGILRKTHRRNTYSPVSSLKSTMASRQALVKGIEWAKIFEKTGPEYRQMINSFKSKSDAIFSSYVKAQATKLDIDWAHYHKNVNNKELVADFESKFNSLEIPRPVDTKSEGLSAKLAADKVRCEEYILSLQGAEVETTSELNRLCSLPPFEQMTEEDIMEHFPRLRPDYETIPYWPHVSGPEQHLKRKDK